MSEFSAQRLREARERRHIARENLAIKIGRSYATVASYEQGYNVPPIATLCRIADELDVPIESFFVEVDEVLA
jgi:transcriptional regulator with XRE-family HTH domain